MAMLGPLPAVAGAGADAAAGEPRVSLESGQPVEWLSEPNYKFALPEYVPQLQAWLAGGGASGTSDGGTSDGGAPGTQRPPVVSPAFRLLEVRSMLESELLAPLSVSRLRAKVAWGLPVPGYAHHVALCLYSLAAFSATLYHIVSTGEAASLTAFACAPLPAWLRLVSLSFTLSKLWEWRDTLVMLERGDSLRKIGFLHLYHHATTFLLFIDVMNFAGGALEADSF